MVGDTAYVDTCLLTFLEHLVKCFCIDLECYVQVEIMLVFELEWHPGHFKKRKVRTIAQFEKRVQQNRFAAGFGFLDFQSSSEREAQEILIELPGFLRIAAPISIVM